MDKKFVEKLMRLLIFYYKFHNRMIYNSSTILVKLVLRYFKQSLFKILIIIKSNNYYYYNSYNNKI